jgi:hypothetical protein
VKIQLSIVAGVLLCSIGGFLMFQGSILGERTTGIARVVGIIGMGLIANTKTPARARLIEERTKLE